MAQGTGSVTVEVNNINEEEGTLRIGLFSPDDKFLETPSYTKDIKIERESTVTAIFVNIPYGTYAISVFHDIDNNDELDANFMGIPKEPVGFSNDHKPKMGPPNFKGAAFTLESPEIHQKIELYTY